MPSIEDRVFARIDYASDMSVPGMLHARLLRSPHPHALVRSIDVSAVDPSVVVLTRDDVADLPPAYGPWFEDQPIVADTKVRHVGDVVAAVAAPTLRQAEEALLAISVEYEPLPAVYDPVAAVADGAPLVHDRAVISDNYANFGIMRPQEGSNIVHRFRLTSGRGRDGFADAEVVVEGRYLAAGAAHVPLEPHATLAWWEDDRLVVVSGTQTPFNNRQGLAKIFGIDEGQVVVHVAPMGGSFGAKTFLRLEPVVAALARKAKAPVRALLSREEEFVTLNRHPAVMDLRVGARRDGTLVAKDIRMWWDTGAYADSGPGVAEKGGYAAIGPYRIPNVSVESFCVYTNLPPNGAFRGYAATQAAWACERLMDKLADRLEMDPLELRMRNLLEDGDRFATGEVMHNVRFKECLQRCADAVDWPAGRHGKGLAVVLKGMTTPSRSEAVIEIDASGHFVVRTATTDMGQRPNETQRRLAAEALGVDDSEVRVGENDTDHAPFDMRTTSSRSTHMMTPAIGAAARELRERVAEKLGIAPEGLRWGQGVVRDEATGAEWSLADFAGARGHGEYQIEGGLDPDTGQGVASAEWHQGAAAACVKVDRDTGMYTVEALHTATYAGRIIDRPGAELQTEGAMILGLGSTLFEAMDFEDGQVRNANMSDYCIPSSADIPPITYDLVEDPSSAPHGLGETAVPPVPAAIGNALASMGIEVTRMPVTPEDVLDALAAGSGGREEAGSPWR